MCWSLSWCLIPISLLQWSWSCLLREHGSSHTINSSKSHSFIPYIRGRQLAFSSLDADSDKYFSRLKWTPEKIPKQNVWNNYHNSATPVFQIWTKVTSAEGALLWHLCKLFSKRQLVKKGNFIDLFSPIW